MGNCLKSQLKEVVNNENLEVLGKSNILINDASKIFSVGCSASTTLDSNNCVFFNGTHEITLPVSSETPVSVTIEDPGKAAIVYIPKYSNTITLLKTQVDPYSQSANKLKNIEFCNYSPNLHTLWATVDDSVNIDNVIGTGLTDISIIGKISGNLGVFVGNINSNVTRIVIRTSENLNSNIMAIKDKLSLTGIFGYGCLSGEIATLADYQASRRTSGRLQLIGDLLTLNGNPVEKSLLKSIYYGTSMEGHDPTAEETAQGWCVR